jgi:hypothetical protein
MIDRRIVSPVDRTDHVPAAPDAARHAVNIGRAPARWR